MRQPPRTGTPDIDGLLRRVGARLGLAPGLRRAVPRLRTKRALRWLLDHAQFDWPFDLLIDMPPLRWAARQVYFRVATPRRSSGRQRLPPTPA